MGKTKIKDIKNPDIRKKPYCKRIGYKKIFKLWKKEADIILVDEFSKIFEKRKLELEKEVKNDEMS